MTLRLKAKRVRYHSELSENLPRKFDNLWETPQRFQMSLTSWDIAAPLLLHAVKIHPESFIKVFLRLSIFTSRAAAESYFAVVSSSDFCFLAMVSVFSLL